MAKKEKKINNDNDELLDKSDYEYEKNIYNEDKKREQELEEKRQQAIAKRRQQEKEAEKARERKIAEERVELAKLKSGIISQEETEDLQEVHEEERVLSFKEKVINFWYHDKVWICLVAFFVVVIAYITITEIQRKKPDMTVLMIADNGLSTRQEELEHLFEQYVDDVDGNGYVYVQIIIAPLNPNATDYQTQSTNNSKFLAQLQTCETMLVITDSNTEQQYAEIMDTNLKADFPNNPYIDNLGFNLNMQLVADELKFEYMPNDVHISIRRPIATIGSTLEEMQKAYDDTFVFYRRMVNDLTQKAIESHDLGLTTEPVRYDSSTTDSTISTVDSKATSDISK